MKAPSPDFDELTSTQIGLDSLDGPEAEPKARGTVPLRAPQRIEPGSIELHPYLMFLSGADAGLAHLSGAITLKELSCVGTKITDAGLEHLKGLKNLEVLKVYNTAVTRPALEELHTVLPNCMVWEPDE